MGAKLSGNNEAEVDDFARCGAYGANPNSTHKDLLRRLPKELWAPEALLIQVPAVDPKGDPNKSFQCDAAIFLASDWLREHK